MNQLVASLLHLGNFLGATMNQLVLWNQAGFRFKAQSAPQGAQKNKTVSMKTMGFWEVFVEVLEIYIQEEQLIVPLGFGLFKVSCFFLMDSFYHGNPWDSSPFCNPCFKNHQRLINQPLPNVPPSEIKGLNNRRALLRGKPMGQARICPQASKRQLRQLNPTSL